MAFGILIAVASTVWLLSCGASVLALYWGVVARARRSRAALVLSCAAILIAYGGLSWIHVSAWKAVNGQLVWRIDSSWFFVGALVLGGAALALTLWNWRRAASRPTAGSLDGAGAVRPFGETREPSCAVKSPEGT